MLCGSGTDAQFVRHVLEVVERKFVDLEAKSGSWGSKCGFLRMTLGRLVTRGNSCIRRRRSSPPLKVGVGGKRN